MAATKSAFTVRQSDPPLTENQSKIKTLPLYLVDQIKAGEIVERPSSLVKEILENALDAGADKIELHLVNNGLDLVKCTDNGRGMSVKDLPMAFARHATSKLKNFQDLYNLDTFGFRGEALAAIAAVSRLSCTSMNSSQEGGKIEIHGGKTAALAPLDKGSVGTALVIKDLFYNTPVRLKFIRSKTTEKNSLKKVINSFLLANPQVQFSIRWDEGEKEIFSAQENLTNRVVDIFFKKKNVEQELFHFEANYEEHRVWGMFSAFHQKGNSGKQHFLFANNRLFNDSAIHHNIIKNLENFWPMGQSGHYLCFIEAPKNLIDVNIHPNKINIKFLKQNLVYSLIHGAIRNLVDKIKKRPEQDRVVKSETETKHEAKSLSNRFYLEHIDGEWMLFDFGMIFSQYLKEHLRPLKQEMEATVLMIAEPFYLDSSWDNFLEQCQSVGLEFSRMNPDTVLLKSVPKILDTFAPGPVIRELLAHLSAPPSSLKVFLQKRLTLPFAPEGVYLNENTRQTLMTGIDGNILNRYQKVLDDKSLAQLFE